MRLPLPRLWRHPFHGSPERVSCRLTISAARTNVVLLIRRTVRPSARQGPEGSLWEARQREAFWQAYFGSGLIGKFPLENPLPSGGAVERCEQMPPENHHGHR